MRLDVLLRYREVTKWLKHKYCFFYKKNQSLVLLFLMIYKAIGSSVKFSSSAQTRCVTVWYCLICTAPYLYCVKSVRMRENADKNNAEYGHFSCSANIESAIFF